MLTRNETSIRATDHGTLTRATAVNDRPRNWGFGAIHLSFTTSDGTVIYLTMSEASHIAESFERWSKMEGR